MEKLKGHIWAIVVICIWGVTYVATELLLGVYTELQVLVLRFTLALLTLYAARPKLSLPKSLAGEAKYMLLSLFGMISYYFLESLAIANTDGTNVSILISFAPVLTSVGSSLFGGKKLTKYTFIGFVIAMVGVILVVFNGTVVFSFRLTGYLFAIGAALSWAIYSIMLDRNFRETDSIIVTRRMILYALVVLIPAMLLKDGMPAFAPLASPRMWLSLALLGVLGGGLCYIWWTYSIKKLGVVVTTNYIYTQPFITMISAYFITGTKITLMGAVGAVLIIGGVVISDKT